MILVNQSKRCFSFFFLLPLPFIWLSSWNTSQGTALHHASCGGFAGVVKLLLAHPNVEAEATLSIIFTASAPKTVTTSQGIFSISVPETASYVEVVKELEAMDGFFVQTKDSIFFPSSLLCEEGLKTDDYSVLPASSYLTASRQTG